MTTPLLHPALAGAPSSGSTSPNSSRRSSIDNKPLLSHSSSACSSPAPTLVNVPVHAPAASSSVARRSFLPPWLVILGWIALSTAVIFMNREILVGRKFAYPITLTSLHLLFQTIATRLLHRYTDLISGPMPSHFVDYFSLPTSESSSEKPSTKEFEVGLEELTRTPNSDGDDVRRWKRESVEMSWSRWNREILPIAVLFSLSLVLSNWAYLYCSVAFIHILKSISPVAILIAAFVFRTKSFSVKLCAIVVTISAGVGIASAAEVNFNMTGFTIQMVAIAIEATRVTLIQILLTRPSPAPPVSSSSSSSSSSSHKPSTASLAAPASSPMSPLKSLYFFAPICLVLNLALLVPLEGVSAIVAIPGKLGLGMVLSNCLLTFGLNLSAVMLIGFSSIVLSLSKVVKDVLMVVAPALLLGESLTFTQVVGYSIATGGLVWYKMTPS